MRVPADLVRGELLREGKAKRVYATSSPDHVWIHYKDEATAFNGVKRAVIQDKGEVNARINAYLMERVAGIGVAHHLEAVLGPRDHLCKRVEIIPVEVVVRNRCAGSICKRFGVEEGRVLSEPLVEFFYKSDALNDPPLSEVHALAFGWAESWELAYLRAASLKINGLLQRFWSDLGVTLVDFKLEFGRYATGQILLADEITPDGSRLWEHGTQRSLDKDVFRRDLGDLGDTYRELFARVFGHALSAE